MKNANALLSLLLMLVLLFSCTPRHTCMADAVKTENETEATCISEGGYDEVNFCSVCQKEWSRNKKTLVKSRAHVYENGKCRDCGAVESIPDAKGYLRCNQSGDPDPSGTYVLFGEYPQSVKAADVTVTDVQDFRGYYLGSDGFYYAAAVASPLLDSYSFATGDGIVKDAVYYFKVEPIRWRIFSETDEKALILCDSIIDCKAYQSSYAFDSETGAYYVTANDVPAETYQNNYAYSEVRAWLNGQFYESAFSETQRPSIVEHTVGNGVSNSGYPTNPYICENTKELVFLPSHMEITKGVYGFDPLAYNRDEARNMRTSDYARAMGTYMQTNETDYGVGSWWLRSPYYEYSNHVREVRFGGFASYRNSATAETKNGVVPALMIRL